MDRDFNELCDRLSDFAARRNWGAFHTPKNLMLALTGEVGELASELQWLSDDGVADALAEDAVLERIAGELADVLIYLVYLADTCGVDVVDAAHRKVSTNEARFPTLEPNGGAARESDLGAG